MASRAAVLLVFILALFSVCAYARPGSDFWNHFASGSDFCPKAIFTFADSLSEAGNRNVEFANITISGSFPYGVSLGIPNGRYADGWVIPDLLNQALDLYPYSITSLNYNRNVSYFTGLDFGYAGATVLHLEGELLSSPHILARQLDEFLDYQDRVYQTDSRLSQKFFSDSLYLIEIGGDDINFHLPTEGLSIVNITVPKVVNSIRESIISLHRNGGAKRVLVFNMPRADCSPSYLQSFVPLKFPVDELGCIAFLSPLIEAFNNATWEMIQDLNDNYPGTDQDGLVVHYFDWYAANTHILQNLEAYNFKSWNEACCGTAPGPFNCGASDLNVPLCGCGNSTYGYTVCENPSDYITFDGIHYTSHFYEVITDFIMNGRFIKPELNLVGGCGVPFHDTPDDPLPVNN